MGNLNLDAGTLTAETWENSDGTENYKCRAWVNFNGIGVPTIRASGNVSSITDNGTGDYTVNFITATSDANYSTVASSSTDAIAQTVIAIQGTNSAQTTSTVRFFVTASTAPSADRTLINVAIFR